MTSSDISLIRLVRHQIAGTKFANPKEIVAWMGAMQAQDYPMAKWAIGVRLPGSTDKSIEAAIDNAEIIRTHLLRPTWHFVAADDIYWLLELTASQIKAAQSSRDRDLGLTVEIYSKSNTLIEKVLSEDRHLTREELIVRLQKAGIATDQNRASHLLARAELEKIICSGPTRSGKPTYALLSERAKKNRELTKDEALAELAKRYFTSRCPATLQDFAWWSGLPARDANHALELVKSDLNPEINEGRTYWLTSDITLPQPNPSTAYLLPPYDEYILSYADRSASISPNDEQHMKEISDRGLFRPIIVVDGQVTGTWKRTIKKDTMIVDIQPFTSPDPSIQKMISGSASQYGHFIGKKLEVNL